MVVTEVWNMPQGNETLWLCKYATNKIHHKVNFCVKFYSMHNPISSNHFTRSTTLLKFRQNAGLKLIGWNECFYIYHISFLNIRFCMLMYTIERQVQFGNLTHMFKKIRTQMCAWEVIPNIFWFCSSSDIYQRQMVLEMEYLYMSDNGYNSLSHLNISTEPQKLKNIIFTSRSIGWNRKSVNWRL